MVLARAAKWHAVDPHLDGLREQADPEELGDAGQAAGGEFAWTHEDECMGVRSMKVFK